MLRFDSSKNCFRPNCALYWLVGRSLSHFKIYLLKKSVYNFYNFKFHHYFHRDEIEHYFRHGNHHSLKTVLVPLRKLLEVGAGEGVANLVPRFLLIYLLTVDFFVD